MIILDTHIWIWWNQDSPRLNNFQKEVKDPADRIIVATARTYDCPLMTNDSNILDYATVKLISSTIT